jgi:hypothetical protein
MRFSQFSQIIRHPAPKNPINMAQLAADAMLYRPVTTVKASGEHEILVCVTG